MTRLGRLNGGVDRFCITHLTDQDHVGILTQSGTEPGLERAGIGSHLALRDRAVDVPVQILDRVLERDDVSPEVRIDVVDHGGLGRRLAGARHPRHEDEPAGARRNLRKHWRQPVTLV